MSYTEQQAPRLVGIVSPACAKRAQQMQREMVALINADAEILTVENVVSTLEGAVEWGNNMDVQVNASQDHVSVFVNVYSADPAEVMEMLCGPLHRVVGARWESASFSTAYAQFNMFPRQGLSVSVYVWSPTGCTFKTKMVRKPESIMVCK